MPKVDVLSAAGKKVGSRDLSSEVFEATVSVQLMHQVVVAGMASLRRGTHATKTRGDVSGGGKKPWRQKGTGRARQGSNRAPQWTGGGVVHGPHPRDHELRVNKKMRKGALRSALTDALQSGKLVALEDLSFDEPKTARAAEVLEALEVDGKVLLVLPEPSETGAVEKSFRNLTGVRIAYAGGLGVYEVIAADKLLLTQAALDSLEGVPAPETPSKPAPKPKAPAPKAEATAEPETDEPEAAEPETDEPEAAEPETDEPEAAEPDSEAEDDGGEDA
jgi:large subunit ribosomal protein L4